MFDIGWTELLVLAAVLILIVGPKELPRMLRTIGQYAGKMRRMANDFRSQFDDAIRETEFEDMRNTMESVRKIDPLKGVRDSVTKGLDPGKPESGKRESGKPESGQGRNADTRSAAGTGETAESKELATPRTRAKTPDVRKPAANSPGLDTPDEPRPDGSKADMTGPPDAGEQAVQSPKVENATVGPRDTTARAAGKTGRKTAAKDGSGADSSGG